jgi:hypothetical protein
VYWIPALHLEGKEVAKGRWGTEEVHRALDEWQKETALTSQVVKTNPDLT